MSQTKQPLEKYPVQTPATDVSTNRRFAPAGAAEGGTCGATTTRCGHFATGSPSAAAPAVLPTLRVGANNGLRPLLVPPGASHLEAGNKRKRHYAEIQSFQKYPPYFVKR
jgi:hypothetical protein